jgi:hydroxyacylglutathione hydrolase
MRAGRCMTMQVSPHVHAMRIPFRIQIAPGVSLERFVYAYLIYGNEICLIDTGVAPAADLILGYTRDRPDA